jgi:hypothetical protein
MTRRSHPLAGFPVYAELVENLKGGTRSRRPWNA